MMPPIADFELEQAIEKGRLQLGPSPSNSSAYQTSDSDVEITDQLGRGLMERRPSLQVQAFSNELMTNVQSFSSELLGARKSEIHPEGKASILPLSELGLRVEPQRPRLSPSISITSEGSHTSHHTDTGSQSMMSMNTPASKAERMKDLHLMSQLELDGDLNTSGFQVHRQPSPLPTLEGFEAYQTPDPSDDESVDASFLLEEHEPSFSEQISMAEARIEEINLRALALKGRPLLGPRESTESAVQADLRDRAFEKQKRKFNTRLFKTELCRSWSEFGYCPYGPRCQFAHGKHEMRNRYRHKRHKTIKCKNFQAGYCPYGSRCCFIHEESTSDLLKMQQQAMEHEGAFNLNAIRNKPSLFYREASIRARSHSPFSRRGYHSMPVGVPSVQASE